jgi:hypothetical protein
VIAKGNKVMNKLVILFLVALTSCCQEFDNKLVLVNQTQQDVYVITYDKPSLRDFPNRILNQENDFVANATSQKMGLFRLGGWNGYVENAVHKKLYLFVILADTVLKYPKEVIISDRKYLQVLSYDLEQLNKQKWRVVITE